MNGSGIVPHQYHKGQSAQLYHWETLPQRLPAGKLLRNSAMSPPEMTRRHQTSRHTQGAAGCAGQAALRSPRGSRSPRPDSTTAAWEASLKKAADKLEEVLQYRPNDASNAAFRTRAAHGAIAVAYCIRSTGSTISVDLSPMNLTNTQMQNKSRDPDPAFPRVLPRSVSSEDKGSGGAPLHRAVPV
ncbi:hypothetical protein BDZ85DRAFT_292981 [Elsinoe ampelina]|uniref:Uncharacterized protein n=1 Tax=Elsinoe ampelina TaxID=302913 RepID=A0A6A6GQW1_9PEZI|nr:hypothetical protein BDZ85DRAFT_292981 [Elsinoe ampelina]